MEYKQTIVGMTEKFTWTINNFSSLNAKVLYSDTFVIGGYPWKIMMYPNGKKVDYLSIYLSAANTTNLPEGWTRDANFKFTLYNQVSSSNNTITTEAKHQFTAKEINWGFPYFIPLSEFRDTCNGFLVNDTCIVAAEVHVPMSGYENHVVVPTASASIEFVDFRGLGKIEKTYILLLDEVCSQHQSLIECQKKRSPRFTEWAFTALGRVLHFLKTKKSKDMNEDVCKDLQTLWEELQTFGFDLTWLEPHVQFALDMKSYIQRAIQLEKLKDNVIALELKMKRLNEKVACTKADLDIARSVLLKAKERFGERFGERDLNVELGYRIPTDMPIGHDTVKSDNLILT